MDNEIVILNDNENTLSSWEYLLPDQTKSFAHPRDLMLYLKNTKTEVPRIYILDRQCKDLFDVVDSNYVGKLKKIGAKGIFFLSSIIHQEGEEVRGFDYTIGPIPKDIEEIKTIISRENLENRLQ